MSQYFSREFIQNVNAKLIADNNINHNVPSYIKSFIDSLTVKQISEALSYAYTKELRHE